MGICHHRRIGGEQSYYQGDELSDASPLAHCQSSALTHPTSVIPVTCMNS